MSAAGWITTSAILVLVMVFGCSGASRDHESAAHLTRGYAA